MINEFSRTELLLGSGAMERLHTCCVAVFGIGGVGGNAAEALVRSGVGKITLIDNDRVSLSNINRQVFALHSTVGVYKTEAARRRLLDIQPELEIETHNIFVGKDTIDEFDFSLFDYVVDAVDNVTAKLLIIQKAQENGVPVISSMGTGNKLDPTALEVADIYDTTVCHLARIMRREAKKRGLAPFKCVYSKEEALIPDADEAELKHNNRPVPGSTSFVPPAAGLIIAGEVIKDLIK